MKQTTVGPTIKFAPSKLTMTSPNVLHFMKSTHNLIKSNKHLCSRISQLELKHKIEELSEELKKISAEQSCPLALEAYTNKLTNTRHKITVISNILQTAQVSA